MQKEVDAILNEFRAAFRDRYRRAQEEKDRGRRVMGWLCLYAPEELFQAVGMLPLRVMGGEGETQQADAHLYSNFCSFVRSCLEGGFKGHYDLLDGLVTCNNCDHIRHLYDVWSRYLKTPYTCILGLPHKMSEAGMVFFAEELRRLKGELEAAFQVDGVIYQKIKFCSLHGGHYPLLGQVLERLGLPILILEREYNTAAVGQMKTRVQAFLEMLAG